MSRSRLLIIHPALAPYRIDLFNRLAVEFDLLIVFLERGKGNESFVQGSLSRLQAKVVYLEESKVIRGRHVPRGIKVVLDDFRPDVVVTHEFSPTSLIAALRKRRSGYAHVIWTADNAEVIRDEAWMRSAMRKMLLRRADGLIVYADETRAIYKGRYRFHGPTGVCANVQSESVLLKAFRDSRAVAAGLLKEHQLEGKRVVLMVGRLVKVKRLDRLIRGFATARERHRELRLVLVGDGPERTALERLASDVGLGDSAIFAGHREGHELYAWFTIASLFVLTSELETWGAVVNEALVAGLPVVCSDRAGARVLIEDGRNGRVIDADDTQRLGAEIDAWATRAAPLSGDSLARERQSLMRNGFDAAVSGFVQTIRSVRGTG
jgi:glycosyltransferase involved in cell wall biosynthesis